MKPITLVNAIFTSIVLSDIARAQDGGNNPTDGGSGGMPEPDDEDSCSFIGVSFNGHCYWKGSMKVGGQRMRQVCKRLMGAPLIAETVEEWEFIKQNVLEIMKEERVNEVFVGGAVVSDEAGEGEKFVSGRKGFECLFYDFDKGEYVVDECRKGGGVICELDDTSKIQMEWTDWYNQYTGRKQARKGNDKEEVKKILKDNPTCMQPFAIECRDAVTKVSHEQTGDVFKEACTLRRGLKCKGKEQEESERCQDYEMRVLCITTEDECATGKAKCGEHEACVDTVDGYLCTCGEGNEECSSKADVCSLLEVMKKRFGKFNC